MSEAIKLPTPKSVCDAIGPLAAWYRKFKPEVTAIAVDPLFMMRIQQMIENRDARGFTLQDGRVYYSGFRVYVAREPVLNGGD